MLMLLGWRVFRYSTELHRSSKQPWRPYIAEHFQSIFTDEPTGLSIYTTASRTIEVFVGEGVIETRLSLWEECATRGTVLEKVHAASALRIHGREAEVITSEGVFFLSFYEENDVRQFASACAKDMPGLCDGRALENARQQMPSEVELASIGMRSMSGHKRVSARHFVVAMNEKSKRQCS